MCGGARGRYAHSNGGREGVLAEKSGWAGGLMGMCGDQTHPVAAEYMVYMTMTRDCDCGGATARWRGGSAAAMGKRNFSRST